MLLLLAGGAIYFSGFYGSINAGTTTLYPCAATEPECSVIIQYSTTEQQVCTLVSGSMWDSFNLKFSDSLMVGGIAPLQDVSFLGWYVNNQPTSSTDLKIFKHLPNGKLDLNIIYPDTSDHSSERIYVNYDQAYLTTQKYCIQNLVAGSSNIVYMANPNYGQPWGNYKLSQAVTARYQFSYVNPAYNPNAGTQTTTTTTAPAPSPTPQPACGDGSCNDAETAVTCPKDCQAPGCTPDWHCDWSACSDDGTQTLSCVDEKQCGGTQGMPKGELKCTPPECTVEGSTRCDDFLTKYCVNGAWESKSQNALVIGECDVECIQDKDCASGQKCDTEVIHYPESYKCIDANKPTQYGTDNLPPEVIQAGILILALVIAYTGYLTFFKKE